MKIDLNQYITDMSYDDALYSNVISCTNTDGNKTVLVRSLDDNNNTLTFENEYFLMKNNAILSVNDSDIGNFHVLVCKKNDIESVNHFIRVCEFLFVKRNVPLPAEEMLKLFNSLETIFKAVTRKDQILEIGLYGELSLLNYMHDKNNDIYKMWHDEFFSKHDLEIDEKIKIEVKTTIKDFRKHTFSHDQIVRPHLKVFVASIMLKTVEKGESLYELCKKTMGILNYNQILNIELQMKKLGLCEEYQGINCIPEETFENIKFYDADYIPKITSEIPEGISNIHYDIDLSNVDSITLDEISR